LQDYSTITELPGSCVIPMQVERAYHRYYFGALYSQEKDVLEVACGGGQGLGLLAQFAKHVVGGDIEEKNLSYARQTYANNSKVKVVKLNAHQMEFPDASFDTIIIYEAIYYLEHFEKFLSEARRLLRKGGNLIICTANKDWPDFNPSPFSYCYYGVPELNQILNHHHFQVKFYGAFPDIKEGAPSFLKSILKRIAIKMHLMPKTMKGKTFLKRLFYGRLIQLPREFTVGMYPYQEPKPLLESRSDTIHTALYVIASKVL